MLAICQRGGLGNRLLTVLSHVEVERKAGRPVVVFWPNSRDFPGEWAECFQPIEGLLALPIHPPMEYADLKEFTIHPECTWEIIDELRPSDQVASQLPTGSYDAVHIRRTDLSPLVEEQGWAPEIPDEHYDAFIADAPTGRVWVATDNPVTQRRMRKRHGSKVMVLRDIVDTGSFRYTDGLWSAVDLFACAHANSFMGSRHSTFSHIAEMLRGGELAI